VRLYTKLNNFGWSDMKQADGQVLARANEQRVLRALHRFGWLRTRDLAALVWTRWVAKPQAELSLAPPTWTAGNLRMAQRTLRRMYEAGLVLQARRPDGTVYTLSEAGARVLRAAGLPASSGKDAVRGLSGGYFRHRCVANEVAIAGIVQGWRVSSEREIARGAWAGGADGIAGKKPDVLLRNGSQWHWVEVQRSRPNAMDYSRLLDWLVHILRRALAGQLCAIAPNCTGLRIEFVCADSFRAKLTHDLAARGVARVQLDSLVRFETALFNLNGPQFT
jgi:hypothetical protein